MGSFIRILYIIKTVTISKNMGLRLTDFHPEKDEKQHRGSHQTPDNRRRVKLSICMINML